MLKWSETNVENIKVLKKYETNNENPVFGQDGIRGRGLSVVSRAIDAVRRFSIRGSLKRNNGNTDENVTNMNIDSNSKSARQGQGSNRQSVFDSTKYTASTKRNNIAPSPDADNDEEDDEEGVDYAFHTNYEIDNDDEETKYLDIESIS